MKNKQKIKDYGYHTPVFDNTNYLAGSLPKIIINPTGDWRPLCTSYEPQFFPEFGGDTLDCTIFGLENAIQIYLKQAFVVDVNYSERFVSNGMNRDNSVGQDPHLAHEWVRHNGLIKQELLPMTSTLAEYRTPRPVPQKLSDEAKKWGYDLKHEYVFAGGIERKLRLNLLREYLKYSPLGVSVTAWYQDENGLYIDRGVPNTHWAVLIHVDENDIMYVYDSYDTTFNGVSTALIKKLHPDHNIEVCKRLYITSKSATEQIGFIAKILKWIAEQIGIMQKEADTLPKPVTNPYSTAWSGGTLEERKGMYALANRVCNEEGLSPAMKRDLLLTCAGESGFNQWAENKNRNGSSDFGIMQFNSDTYLKEYKMTPEEELKKELQAKSDRLKLIEQLYVRIIELWKMINSKKKLNQ